MWYPVTSAGEHHLLRRDPTQRSQADDWYQRNPSYNDNDFRDSV